MTTPQIIAHRGASYLAPENTLVAFRKAMEIGADGVEMDVQQTSDKKLVIHHDFVIDWHTDMRGQIYDMTEGELKALDFGSWKDVNYRNERIATLQEALALCRSMEGCAVQLEMKSTMDNDPAFVSGVVDAIRAADIADRLVLISFNHDLLRQAKALGLILLAVCGGGLCALVLLPGLPMRPQTGPEFVHLAVYLLCPFEVLLKILFLKSARILLLSCIKQRIKTINQWVLPFKVQRMASVVRWWCSLDLTMMVM
jgi:hypothetical protein